MSNYCPEIYKGLFVDRWNDDNIRVAPCCQAPLEQTPTKDFNFATNSYLHGLREQFDQGKQKFSQRKEELRALFLKIATFFGY